MSTQMGLNRQGFFVMELQMEFSFRKRKKKSSIRWFAMGNLKIIRVKNLMKLNSKKSIRKRSRNAYKIFMTTPLSTHKMKTRRLQMKDSPILCSAPKRKYQLK
jgi:hypothetical protein